MNRRSSVVIRPVAMRSSMHAVLCVLSCCFVTTIGTGCSTFRELRSVDSAIDLAVQCHVEEALLELGQAEQGGKAGQGFGGLARVAILKDASRHDEAASALADFKSRFEGDDWTEEEIEKTVDDFLDELRNERLKKTGTAKCPV